jgi:hypothetical protein
MLPRDLGLPWIEGSCSKISIFHASVLRIKPAPLFSEAGEQLRACCARVYIRQVRFGFPATAMRPFRRFRSILLPTTDARLGAERRGGLRWPRNQLYQRVNIEEEGIMPASVHDPYH